MFCSLFVVLFSGFPILFAAKFYTNTAIDKRSNLDATASYYQLELKGGAKRQEEPPAKAVEDYDPLADLVDFPFVWDDQDYKNFEHEDELSALSESESDFGEDFYFIGEKEEATEKISVPEMVVNQTSSKPADGKLSLFKVKQQKLNTFNPYNSSFYESYQDSEASSFDIPKVDEPADFKVSYPDSGSFTDVESLPSPFPVTDKFTSIDHHALRNSQTTTPISDANQRISGLSKLLSASSSPVPISDNDSSRATPDEFSLRNFGMNNAPTVANALKNYHKK